MKDLGVKYKIQGEILTDALEYAHNCGDVLWLQNHHKLKEVVFHKPFKLIEALRGIIHHDISSILDFDGNKSFSSIGKLSKVNILLTLERHVQYDTIFIRVELS